MISNKNLENKPFNEMSLREKGIYILSKGKYLKSKAYQNHVLNLYIVGDIFYELWYSPVKNKITWIEPIKQDNEINKYID